MDYCVLQCVEACQLSDGERKAILEGFLYVQLNFEVWGSDLNHVTAHMQALSLAYLYSVPSHRRKLNCSYL